MFRRPKNIRHSVFFRIPFRRAKFNLNRNTYRFFWTRNGVPIGNPTGQISQYGRSGHHDPNVAKYQEDILKSIDSGTATKQEVRDFVKACNDAISTVPAAPRINLAGSLLFPFLRGFVTLGILVVCVNLIVTKIIKNHPITDSLFPDSSQFFEEISPDDDGEGLDENGNVRKKLPKFSDVCGNQEAKEELQDVVEFLRNPDKFARMGVKVPRGVLLMGPPGCGKTLMARALAGEAKATFLSTAGSNFDEIFVGVGSGRVKKLFTRARELSPCIIFIDEFDSIGTSRSAQGNNTRTLNQLLVELDGFNQDEGIILLAATNMAERLDSAVTRSGRFDRKVSVHFPDKIARKQIIELNLKKKTLADDVDVEQLAVESTFSSGADIANFVNLAATLAIKAGKNSVSMRHFREAILTTQHGPQSKSMKPTKKNLRKTAFHEAGHLIMSLSNSEAIPMKWVTILPRGQSLGANHWEVPEDRLHTETKCQMLAQIDICMGGHAAEEMILGKENVCTGARSDLARATNIATKMVTKCGMSDRVGKVFYGSDDLNALDPDTRTVIDEEIKRILDESYQRTQDVLTDRSKDLHLLAEALIEKESLSREEIAELLDR
eukprot:101984_1